MDAGTRTRARVAGPGRWAVALGVCLAASGCTATRIEGTAVRGQIGKAILVPWTDTRLSDGGLGGIEVSVTSGAEGRGGHVVVAKGTTAEDGTFSIPIRGRVPPSFMIRATGEGEYDVRSSIARPNSGERVLILMRPPRAP